MPVDKYPSIFSREMETIVYVFLFHTALSYINYLITESEVVTGKSQTEALPY